MGTSKVRQLQPSAKKNKKTSSNVKDEIIQRTEIKNSPFEVITRDGEHWGVMGNYRLTEVVSSKKQLINELEKVTWNRIIQVVMILSEITEKRKQLTKKD